MSTLAPVSGSTAAARRRVTGRYADAALLAAIVAIVVVFDWAFASRSFFFGDDLVTFWEGKARGLSFDYLTTPIVGGHFSPGVRLLSYGLLRLAPLDWNVALGVVLAFHAASVVLVQRTLAALFGRAWWTFALSLAFGLSMILMARIYWFSAAAQGIPAIALSLACIHAHVTWWRTGRAAWLAWSVAALCAALCFYESAALVPVYLGLVRLLLLRSSPRELLREWRVWVLYAVPVAVLAVVVITGGYESGGSPKLSVLPNYLWHAWIGGVGGAGRLPRGCRGQRCAATLGLARLGLSGHRLPAQRAARRAAPEDVRAGDRLLDPLLHRDRVPLAARAGVRVRDAARPP